jgi:uncharacterized protein YijF (DUF1287 family)
MQISAVCLMLMSPAVPPDAVLAQEPASKPPSDLQRIVEAAHRQVGVTVSYDPSYVSIPFPGGDVPVDRGVCTDVIIRAYRSIGVDLQLLVNKDMRKDFRAYPRKWGLSRPDPNIDHRRVDNLAVFFTRNGQSLPVTKEAADYKPGDLVAWKLADGRPHIGLVSDRSADGRPLLVHNIGAGAKVEDILFAFTITGHYRYMPGKGEGS